MQLLTRADGIDIIVILVVENFVDVEKYVYMEYVVYY